MHYMLPAGGATPPFMERGEFVSQSSNSLSNRLHKNDMTPLSPLGSFELDNAPSS